MSAAIDRRISAGVAEVTGRLRGGRLVGGTAALVRGECTIAGGLSGRKRG